MTAGGGDEQEHQDRKNDRNRPQTSRDVVFVHVGFVMIALRSLLNGSVGTSEAVVEETVDFLTGAHLVLVVVVFVDIPRYQCG